MKKYKLPPFERISEDITYDYNDILKEGHRLTPKGIISLVYTYIEEYNQELSLCRRCGCMTKTFNNICGKCGKNK